jgi:hypothetical protein
MLPARYLLISGLSVLWCSDARAQARPPLTRNGVRAELLGCYALYSGRTRVSNALYNATPSVRLDSLTVGRLGIADTVPGIRRALIPLTAANERVATRRGPPSWTADSLTDSVRLSFVDGFSGTVFVLAAAAGRADTLTGRLFESWDFGPPFQTTHGPARAVRQPCEAGR